MGTNEPGALRRVGASRVPKAFALAETAYAYVEVQACDIERAPGDIHYTARGYEAIGRRLARPSWRSVPGTWRNPSVTLTTTGSWTQQKACRGAGCPANGPLRRLGMGLPTPYPLHGPQSRQPGCPGGTHAGAANTAITADS
ncbi:MAG: hypothetical protein Q7J57_08990 [Gemmobacter sp.]|nr:hypothetical protein [Gemmobacter sp.]